MRLLFVTTLIFFVLFHNVNGSGCCTCKCCRGTDCQPVKQTPINVESCDIDGKCNLPCCQTYPSVCFPLPGPGVVDSDCRNYTVCNS